MKKRLKKKLFSYIVYSCGSTSSDYIFKVLEMRNRWRLYEKLAAKEGLIKIERKWLPIRITLLDKNIETALKKEYLDKK